MNWEFEAMAHSKTLIVIRVRLYDLEFLSRMYELAEVE